MASLRCAYMSKRGISGQPGCVLSFRQNFRFGKILVFWPEFCPNYAKQEIMPETQNTPRMAQNAPFAHVGAPRGCQSVVLSVHMAKTRHSGRMSGRKTARKRPTRGSEDKNWPKHEGKPKIIYTPRLAGNDPFAHVGAPRGCQSVLLSVHMAKTRHSGRIFGRKTARKRPNRDRIRISATEFQLE